MSALCFKEVAGIGTVMIGYKEPTRLRLNDTCFRPGGEPLAGNFLVWRSIDELLYDKEFVARLLAALPGVIGSIVGDRDRKKYFSVEHERVVGWTSTAPMESFKPEELEPFAPNSRCTGLRVQSDTAHLAPLTKVVTFSCDCLRLPDYWSLEIFSIYPGTSVGPLEGEISKRTGQAFYRFTHPGVLPDT